MGSVDKKLCAFFKMFKIAQKDKVIISADLDNTFVIRKKGSNYVNPLIKKIITKLVNEKKIIFLPNTGRELIGFDAFKRQAINCNNGILCSGSLIINNNNFFLNSRSKIDKKSLEIFLKAVKKDKLSFVDLSHSGGRLIVYGDDGYKYKDLFFSQNPLDWFGNKKPPTVNVNNIDSNQVKDVFRIEFPVISDYPNQRGLLSRLLSRENDNIKELLKTLGLEGRNYFDNYSLKFKHFFNESYGKDRVSFSRLAKLTKFANKGIGLKIWLDKAKLSPQDNAIIHIGDQDKGLINDSLVKREISSAAIVMVGGNCDPNNPDVDLYHRGDPERYLLKFFQALVKELSD